MRYSLQLTSVVVAAASLQFAGCSEKSTYTKVEPAHVEHKEGEAISRLTLTEKAMERLAVETTPVQSQPSAENQQAQSIVPYSSLVYVATGEAFVYTNPEPRVFVRHPVEVDYIEGDLAVLKNGPAPGTQVASVGTIELFGTEFGVGH
jgi:hypothetical protein